MTTRDTEKRRHWGPSQWRYTGQMLLVLWGVLALLTSCGRSTVQAPPRLPKGTYISTKYHFRVSYPQGWVANTAPNPSPLIPLTVLITKSSTRQVAGSLVSTFTVAVFGLTNKDLAASAQNLPTDKTKHKVTISGMTAYADAPIRQAVPGTALTEAHLAYYLVYAGYEYQISTDAVSDDQADTALRDMLASFTILR